VSIKRGYLHIALYGLLKVVSTAASLARKRFGVPLRFDNHAELVDHPDLEKLLSSEYDVSVLTKDKK